MFMLHQFHGHFHRTRWKGNECFMPAVHTVIMEIKLSKKNSPGIMIYIVL